MTSREALAALGALILSVFLLIAGIEIGRTSLTTVLRAPQYQHVEVPMHPGVWVERVTTSCRDVEPPADCGLWRIIQLDMTQGTVWHDPLPWSEELTK